MAGQITTKGASIFLRSFFGKREDLIPNQFWIALIGAIEPSVSSTGTDIDELDSALYPSYQRAQFENDNSNWQISGSDTIFNVTAIEFPVANEEWGEANYFAICNTANGGDVIAFGDLATRQFVIQGDRVQIDIGGISFTMYNPAYEGD